MSQIKAKQIQLVAQGDLVVGNGTADGSVLSVGALAQVLISNGTTPAWGQVSAAGISLTEGDVFIGDATNTAAESSASQEGQVVVSGSGPSFDLAIGSLDAQFVTFSPDAGTNITSTNVQTAVVEVAAEHSYIHTASIDPVATNDGVDTAVLGVEFKIGDIWVNTLTDNVFHAVDVSTAAAVWVRGEGVAGAFVYKGDLDAGNTGDVLPSSPLPGDWYRISASSGTQNFNGTWDAAGEPNGATFEIGDSVVFGDDGDWHKVDNTDPIMQGGDGISVTGGPATFTVAVDADEITITATGGLGTQIAVHGGLTNQVLVGAGASSDATWNYVDNLYDSNGNIILDGVGAATPVNTLRVSSANTLNNVAIESVGTDANIGLDITAKGTGRITLDGTQWPDAGVAAFSVLAAQSANDLSAVTATDAIGNQVLLFNDSTNLIEWTLASNIGGNAWSTLNGDSGTAIADTVSDTLTIAGGEAITTVATDNPEVLTIDLDIPELVSEPLIDTANDVFVFFDITAAIHRKITLDDMFTSVNSGQVAQNESVAVGGVNEAFVGFFTFTPIADSTVTVFFNGLELRASGWTRVGNNLTLVDVTNGYQTDTGDIIAARYEH